MAKTKTHFRQDLLNSIIKFHLYALVVLIPLIFWFDTETIFTLPKLLALRVFSISAGFFILLKFFLVRKISFKLPQRSIFLGFWALSLILSTVFSINQVTSIFGQYGRFLGLITLLNLILIPVYIANFFRREDYHKIIDLSIFTAVLAALYGLLQYFNFFGIWPLDFSWTDAPQNRVFGTMGHANHLGAYLSAHFLLLLYRFNPADLKNRHWANWLRLIGFLISLMLLVTVILLTASRGAVLALVMSSLVIFTLKFWKNRHKISKTLGRTLATLFCLIVLVLSGLFLFSNDLQDLSLIRRTEGTIQTINKGIIPDRLSFLFSAWQMFIDHPLSGTGLSTFRDAYSAYRRTDYLIDGPGNAQYITVPESAHNQYADILSTQGLIGLIAYLALILAVLNLSYRQFKAATPAQENFHLALLGALLVFLFQTLFNFGEIINLFLFYLLIGLIMGADAQSPRLPLKISNIPVYLISMAGIVGLVLAAQYGLVPVVRADYFYKQAELAAANQKLDLANHYFQMIVAAKPQEYSLSQAYGDFSMQAAASAPNLSERQSYLRQAVQNYQKAVLLNNHYPSTYHNLALAYIELYRLTKIPNYLDLAKQSYLKSLEKSPNNPRYLYEYARKLHSDWNDPEGSIKLLLQAHNLAPDYQEPLDYLNFLYKNYPQLASPLK